MGTLAGPLVTSVSAKPASVVVTSVKAGETWRFTARGTWVDCFIPCGPDGYRLPPADFLDIRPGVESAKWFALVGFVGSERFVIGTETEYTFTSSGELCVCANDLANMRWNNWGSVTLQSRRLSAPSTPTPPDLSADNAIPPGWAGLAEIARRTQGFLFIAVSLVLSGGLLAISTQGRDLITAIVQNGTTKNVHGQSVHLILLELSTVVLGLQAWFWARAIVSYQFGERANWRERRYLLWVPRLFGALPFVFLVYAIASVGPFVRVAFPAILLTLLGVSVLTFVVARDAIAQRIVRFADRMAAVNRPRLAMAVHSTLDTLKYRVLVTSFLGAMAGMAAVIAWPVEPASAVGAAAVVLFGVALVIPPMVLFIQTGTALRFPATPLLIALACLFTLVNDNHAVRLLTPTTSMERVRLQDAFATWLAQASPAHGTVPIIFVAAEGGASRAGYWTSDALGALEEHTHGEFSKHLFFISSISGGSLGAIAYVATLKDNPSLVAKGQLRDAIDDFAGRDYLSPALAGMLYPDLLQRLIPFPLLRDRAFYLERSWEVGWTAHCADINGRCSDNHLLEKGFLSLWPAHNPAWIPILSIGGAREEDGRRIQTSSVYFHGGLIDADDFHTITQREVRASTAMLNGARFPFVSPAGTLPPVAGGHILDGGYFDSAGIETMREAAAAVLSPSFLAANSPNHAPAKLTPIFILLENGAPSDPNDPDCAKPGRAASNPPPASASLGATPAKAPKSDPPLSRTDEFAADTLAPFVGMLSSRDAHAAHLRFFLDHLKGSGGSLANAALIEIRVRNDPTKIEFPLDWILSEDVKQEMRAEIDDAKTSIAKCDNTAEIKRIANLLGQ